MNLQPISIKRNLAKYLLLFCLLVQYKTVPAQDGYFVIKKNHKVIERIQPGKAVDFATPEYMPVHGWVRRCTKDSIFIMLGYMGLVNVGMGTKIDSIKLGLAKFSTRDIGTLLHNRITLSQIGNGIFRIGIIAGAIVGASQINGDMNTRLLAQFGAAALANFTIGAITPFRNRKPVGYRIGKKYKLEFIAAAPF